MAINEETLDANALSLTETGRDQKGSRNINIGKTERWASSIGGGALAVYGLTRGSLGGIALALLGGALINRGVSGHCAVYDAMGHSSAEEDTTRRGDKVSVPGGRGIKVEKSVTINRPAEEIYSFWRNFQNLPRFMKHLESVNETGDGRSHWVAKAPAGQIVEWDAEVYNDKENEMIAWRSLEGSDVNNAGSVHFTPLGGGRGTAVRVVFKYEPPGGAVGALVAKLFGENPEQQVDEDLRRLKQVLEAGEIATTKGQPSGRKAASAGK